MRDLKQLSVQLQSISKTYLFQIVTPAHRNEFFIKFVLAMGVQYDSACLVP